MTVQLIVGRSGSGKTHACLEQIRAELLAAPLGPPLILLAPEQASFQMEQALPDPTRGLTGYHRVEVYSFQRLARRMIETSFLGALKPLSEFGRQMVLRRVIWQMEGRMKLFGRAVRRQGFIVELSKTIRELRQYRKTPDELRQYAESIRGAAPQAGLADKLEDLALLLEGYQDYIKGRYIDPDDYLDWLCTRCDLREYLAGARVWIDGFAGFTPQQYEAIRALMLHSGQVAVSLCLDPSSPQFAEAQRPQGRLDELDVFYPVLDTCQRLMTLARESGLAVAAPVCLGQGRAMPRFEKAPALAQLERTFLAGRMGGPAGQDAVAPAGLTLVESASQRDEVNSAAREILGLCREQGYRFGEIAVIVRSLEGYRELLEAAFAEHGIPFFSDVRREVAQHPLVSLIRAALNGLLNDFRLDGMLAYLKSDLSPLGRAEVDELENYCLAHDIRGGQWRAVEAWPGDGRLDGWRRRAMAPLEALAGRLAVARRQNGCTGRVLSGALVEFLLELDVPGQLARWYRECEGRGELETAQSHREVWRQVLDLLDELVEALGDQPLEPAEFAGIIESVLPQMSLPLVPPALDQVLIGAIERSRQPRIRAAFVLGVNEGRFPLAAKPGGLFTDQQRSRFALDRFELAPPDGQRLLRERYLGYIAFTRASDYLWISYPLIDRAGKVLAPSSFIGDILRGVAGARVASEPDSRSAADPGRIATAGQLGVQLAGALGDCHGEPGRKVAPVWGECYRQALMTGPLGGQLAASLGGVVWSNRAGLDGATAQRLRAGRPVLSVTQLEQFAQCPFSYYCRYDLGLKERELLQLEPVDLGRLYHELLEALFNQMKHAGKSWQDFEPDDLAGRVTALGADRRRHDPQMAGLLAQSARNRFLFDLAVSQVARLCHSLAGMARAGEFRQEAAELVFGERGTLGPLTVVLPGGGSMQLSGKIDRVDGFYPEPGRRILAVYDFKSASAAWDVVQFYYGLKLQLMTYLLVLLEAGRAQGVQTAAAAALYLPVNRKGKAQKGAPPDEMLEPDYRPAPARHKAVGVLNERFVKALDGLASGASDYFDFRINLDGAIGKTTSVVADATVAAMTGYTGEMLGRLGQRLAAGQIAVHPYRYQEKQTPCPWCSYRGVCRFDPSVDTYRHLPTLDKASVYDRIVNGEVYGG